MRIRSLILSAAVTMLFMGGQQLAAQQMSPYAMQGAYGPVAPMSYGAPAGMYAPARTPYYMAQAPAPVPAASVTDTAIQDAAGCVECGDTDCGGTCSSCGCWSHKVAVFGEFMYLRARNSEVTYGVPIDGPIVGPPTNNPIQIGRMGVVDMDYQPAFRIGAAYILDSCSSLTVQWSRLESSTGDRVDTTNPNVIRSMVSHPGTLSAAQDFLSGVAGYDINYDLIDIDYRTAISWNACQKVNWVFGARYARLEEKFDAVFAANGIESVLTDISFDGAGLRAGIEGERYSRSGRLMVYGKTYGSLLAGEFRGHYNQSQSFDPQVVDTTWKAGRIVPVLDLEAGVGWQSQCGTWRLTAGYVYSAWLNTVKTDRFIQAVQNNNFAGLGDTMTFDGLIARVEGRF